MKRLGGSVKSSNATVTAPVSPCGARDGGAHDDVRTGWERDDDAGWVYCFRRPSGKYGYLSVTLSREGRQRAFLVHQLVAMAFLGPRPEGTVVMHGPNGHLDNRASELSYGTEKENHGHKLRDGTHNRGERHCNSKLTAAMVAEIRQRYAAGETSYAMAPDYGVAPSTIRAVLSGFSWGHSGEAVLNGPRRGTSHQDARLTDTLVLECRRHHAAGESVNSIAKAFGMSWSAMGKAVRGQTWTHVPMP